MIPDEKQALELHKKYGSNDRIVEHCRTVTRVAVMLTDKLAVDGKPVNRKAVLAGALLHDIGRNKTQTVQHGYVGAEIIKDEGIDQVVVEIVKRHVGAGISKQEAASLGFPPGDYIPSTLEEKLVCFSDKMVSGEVVRPFYEEVQRFVKKGHDVERLKRLRSDVAVALGSDPEKIIFAAP